MVLLRKSLITIILFFCLFAINAFAESPPQVGELTPDSGESQPGEEVFFTTTYIDPDGYDTLRYGLFRLRYGTITSFYGNYRQDRNKLYLYDYGTSAWTEGIEPGSQTILDTTYATLDCSRTTIQGQGDTLTVTWAVTFKENTSGIRYYAYLYAKDLAGAKTGWIYKGTWTVGNTSPSTGTITPSSGKSQPGEEVFFTTTYIDPDGYDRLLYGLFLINTKVSAKDCFYGYYRQDRNKLYLYKTGEGWIGGVEPGSDVILENDHAKLDCFKTTIEGQYDTLSVTWAVTFKDTFTGMRNMYLYAKDYAGVRTGWQKRGTWKIGGVPYILRFQGMLKDKYTGELLNGTVDLTFRLYENDTASTWIWEEVHSGVSIEGGLLDVELGNFTSLDDLSFDKQYWLGVEVDQDGEMTPRFKLTSVPYAIKSEQ